MSHNFSEVLGAAARLIPCEEVTAWLGRLVLLYGVPFNYLIPEEAMLPGESIRFFFLDPVWLQYLVQGACSVGNTSSGDTIIDRAMNKLVQQNQPDKEGQPGLANRAAAGVRDRLRNQYEGIDIPKESEDLDWPLTGFLLRSPVVEGWRGLEIMAYKKISEEEKKTWAKKVLTEKQKTKLEKEGVAPLKPLRIEQISPDVMFGIFNGIIKQLVIRQPQEGLHFGLTPPSKDENHYTKTLRELGYYNPENADKTLQDAPINSSDDKLMSDKDKRIINFSDDNSDDELMRDKGKRIINVKNLAKKMEERLSKFGQLSDNKFTSAEFAVEMIESPGEFTFITNMPRTNK